MAACRCHVSFACRLHQPRINPVLDVRHDHFLVDVVEQVVEALLGGVRKLLDVETPAVRFAATAPMTCSLGRTIYVLMKASRSVLI